MNEDDWYRPKRSRQQVVDEEMARLRLDTPEEHPDIAARKAREAADRLLVHDRRWDLTDRSDEAVARRLGYSAGDDGANE